VSKPRKWDARGGPLREAGAVMMAWPAFATILERKGFHHLRCPHFLSGQGRGTWVWGIGTIEAIVACWECPGYLGAFSLKEREP